MSHISRGRYRIKTKNISYESPKMQIAHSSCQRVQKGARATFSRAIIESPVRKPERDKSWERWKKSLYEHGEVEGPGYTLHSLMDIVNFYIKKYNSLFSVSGAFSRVTHAWQEVCQRTPCRCAHRFRLSRDGNEEASSAARLRYNINCPGR